MFLVEGYFGPEIAFETELDTPLKQKFGAFLKCLDDIKENRFFDLKSVKFMGKKQDLEILAADFEKYKNDDIRSIYDKIDLKKPEKNEKRSLYEPKLYCYYNLDIK